MVEGESQLTDSLTSYVLMHACTCTHINNNNDDDDNICNKGIFLNQRSLKVEVFFPNLIIIAERS